MERLTIKKIDETIDKMPVNEALNYLYTLRSSGISCNIEKIIMKYEKLKALEEKEIERFNKMCSFEISARNAGKKLIAGIDEAGRGPLAGPVVAACVILPENVFIKGLNDSKKLTPAQREALYDEIVSKAVAYGIGYADEKVIDEINILNATKLAMIDSIKGLGPVEAEHVRLDGPIKELGMYTVKLKFHEKVLSEVKVWVVPSATSG